MSDVHEIDPPDEVFEAPISVRRAEVLFQETREKLARETIRVDPEDGFRQVTFREFSVDECLGCGKLGQTLFYHGDYITEERRPFKLAECLHCGLAVQLRSDGFPIDADTE